MKFTLVVSLFAAMFIGAGCQSRSDDGPQLTEAPKNWVRDPVCGMMVDPKNAPAKLDYNGKTYYFCSREDKERFEKSLGHKTGG